MVHNGIEYGLMQAYAEGFALLHRKREFTLRDVVFVPGGGMRAFRGAELCGNE